MAEEPPLRHDILCADCLPWMQGQPTDSVDLVFGSPPYEDARIYKGEDYATFRGQLWVDWMVPRALEAVRICKGLVAFVVEGRTRGFSWSATPILLMADLHRAGITLRKPAAFRRVGIPGSGGPDWLRNDYEFIICATSGGKLPWSDNCAMGKPCKYSSGGPCSNWSQHGRLPAGNRRYAAPRKGIANPGNVINCQVGGGHMGSGLAHQNEAAFPEALAEFFVRSFCPPGGIVYDPFHGSGTVTDVCIQHGRASIGTDIRQSQADLATKRAKGAREIKTRNHKK